jgi:hypothetical protein
MVCLDAVVMCEVTQYQLYLVVLDLNVYWILLFCFVLNEFKDVLEPRIKSFT